MKKAKVNEQTFVPVKNAKKGKIYVAYDKYLEKQGKEQKVKILSIKKDEGGYFNVKVQFVSGDMKGQKDDWYLEPDDKVFVKESVNNRGVIKMAKKKKKENLNEGAIMLASLMPVGGVHGLGGMRTREDNFEFKGFPGQFDKDGKKVIDDNGQTIGEVEQLIESICAHLKNSDNKKDEAKEIIRAIKPYLK